MTQPRLAYALLAIDPGHASGWAIVVRGRLSLSGKATSESARRYAVALAVRTAAEEGLPLVVVGETWGPGGLRTGIYHAMLDQWREWKRELSRAGIGRDAIVRYDSREWHEVLEPYPRHADFHALTIAHARKWVGGGARIGDDEADAIGIASYAVGRPEIERLAAELARTAA